MSALHDEVEREVNKILKTKWTTREGQKVPSPEDIQLGNHAVKLDGTVLYADLRGSTELVNGYKDWFAAEIYKTFLYAAAKVIRSEGGEITAYDGDRVMAVYVGSSKNTAAARTALKINYATKKIINPAIKKRYPKSTYQEVRHTVGIDTSSLFIARTGIRGSNDLVWVGRSANYAAKLTEQPSSHPSYITKDVFDMLHKEARIGADGRPMWEQTHWAERNMTIYRSTWWWPI